MGENDNGVSAAIWTLARFIETAEAYDFHTAAREFKQGIYDEAVTVRGVDPMSAGAVAMAGRIAEHEQQITIHETTLRQFVTKFPALRSHWAVAELELNFLDP